MKEKMESIPKILHYCWFGHGEMPKVFKKCFKSWQKKLPDYQFMLWDESNFDVNCNVYVKQAYDAKKYMYVSDYCRLKALYDYGGVYLDVDCFVKKSYNPLLNDTAFTGFGTDNREIAACTLAFQKGHPLLKESMQALEAIEFVQKDGSYDTYSINRRITDILKSKGYKDDGTKQRVADVTIYPMTYFCPLSMLPDTVKDCKSKNTYSISIYTDKGIKRERCFLVKLAHKLKFNEIKRKLKR